MPRLLQSLRVPTVQFQLLVLPDVLYGVQVVVGERQLRTRGGPGRNRVQELVHASEPRGHGRQATHSRRLLIQLLEALLIYGLGVFRGVVVEKFEPKVGDVKDETVVGRDLAQLVLCQRGAPELRESNVLGGVRVALVLALPQVLGREVREHVLEFRVELLR